MAITTTLDHTDYLVTVRQIVSEFLKTHFVGDRVADIRLTPRAAEGEKTETPLSLPIIRVLMSPGGETRQVGAGRVVGDDERGEWKDLVFGLVVSTDEATGGELTRDRLSGWLEKTVLEHGNELAQAGLRYPEVSPAALIDTDEFFQNWHELRVQILLRR